MNIDFSDFKLDKDFNYSDSEERHYELPKKNEQYFHNEKELDSKYKVNFKESGLVEDILTDNERYSYETFGGSNEEAYEETLKQIESKIQNFFDNEIQINGDIIFYIVKENLSEKDFDKFVGLDKNEIKEYLEVNTDITDSFNYINTDLKYEDFINKISEYMSEKNMELAQSLDFEDGPIFSTSKQKNFNNIFLHNESYDIWEDNNKSFDIENKEVIRKNINQTTKDPSIEL